GDAQPLPARRAGARPRRADQPGGAGLPHDRGRRRDDRARRRGPVDAERAGRPGVTAGGGAHVAVRVAGPLAFLLPARDRAARERRLRFDPDATAGHLVQAAGVPLPETGELRVDGAVVARAARTRPGSVVEV